MCSAPVEAALGVDDEERGDLRSLASLSSAAEANSSAAIVRGFGRAALAGGPREQRRVLLEEPPQVAVGDDAGEAPACRRRPP